MPKSKGKGEGNSFGTYKIDRIKDMKSFDQLPKRIRIHLSQSFFDIAAPTVRSWQNRLGVEATIARISELQIQSMQETRIETWGSYYPNL